MQTYLSLSNYSSLLDGIKQASSIKIRTNLSKIVAVSTSEIKKPLHVSPKKRWSKSPESRMKKLVLFKMNSPSSVENDELTVIDVSNAETKDTKSKLALSAEKREQRSIQFRKYRMERQSPSLKKHMNLFKTGRFSPILVDTDSSSKLVSIESELMPQNAALGVNLSNQFHKDCDLSQTINLSASDSNEYISNNFCQEIFTSDIPIARLKDVVDGIEDSPLKVEKIKTASPFKTTELKVVPFGTLAYELISQKSDVAEIQTTYSNLLGHQDYSSFDNDAEFAKVVRFRSLDYELIRPNSDIAEYRTKVELSNMKYLTKSQSQWSKFYSNCNIFFKTLIQFSILPLKIVFGTSKFSRLLKFASSCFLFIMVVSLISLRGPVISTEFEQVASLASFEPSVVTMETTISSLPEMNNTPQFETESFDTKSFEPIFSIEDKDLKTKNIIKPESDLLLVEASVEPISLVELIATEPSADIGTALETQVFAETTSKMESSITVTEHFSEAIVDDIASDNSEESERSIIEEPSTFDTSLPLLYGLACAVSMAFGVFTVSHFMTPSSYPEELNSQEEYSLPEVENLSHAEELETIESPSSIAMVSRLSLNSNNDEPVLGSFINPESLRITVVLFFELISTLILV